MTSIKENLIYKGLLTFSNYIIGFVTFPYITRILGPDNFGAVNFTLNTVDYFLLFANMGISTIGTREVAICREDKDQLNTTFSRIFGLNIWFTLLTIIGYYIAINYVTKFSNIYDLMAVGGAKILFTVFAVEWFFTGIENFKYITFRSLFVKSAYVISVFLFVKSQEDSILYLILTVGSVVLNSIVNFIYVNRFIKIKYSEFFSLKYLVPNIRMGFYFIMTSMYITFNVMFLGLVTNNLEVAYYSTAVKLYFIVISLFSAYTTVMLPRMTSLSGNHTNQYNKYLYISFCLVLFFAFPIISECIVLSPHIIYVLSGAGYEAAVLPMRILMPALILVWCSQVIVFQGLVPNKNDNVLFKASILGGFLSLIINLMITKHWGAIGSSVVLLSCEIVVTSYYCRVVQSKKMFHLPDIKTIMRYLIMSLPYLILSLLLSLILNSYLVIFLAVTGSALLFIVFGRKELIRIKNQ